MREEYLRSRVVVREWKLHKTKKKLRIDMTKLTIPESHIWALISWLTRLSHVLHGVMSPE